MYLEHPAVIPSFTLNIFDQSFSLILDSLRSQVLSDDRGI